jgi:hypothetical protein
MLLSTLKMLFLFINWMRPNMAKHIAVNIGTSPSQSVITYSVIFTPVRLCIALLSVVNPTLEPFGPIGNTSTMQIKIVHNMNARNSAIDVSKIVLFLFILRYLPLIYKHSLLKNILKFKKRCFTMVTPLVSFTVYY